MAARISGRGSSAHLIPGALSGVLILTAGLAATTQYLAWSYRFAAILGAPWLRGAGLPYAQNVYAPWAALVWLSRAGARCWARSLRRIPCDPPTLAALHQSHVLLFGSVLAATVVGVIVATIVQSYSSAGARAGYYVIPPLGSDDRPDFAIEVGTATGKLLNLGHGAAVSPKTALRLEGDDAAKNIAIYGGIGSGKTTRAINRYASQSLRQNCGMLAFDVKGDYFQTLETLARSARRTMTTIGVGARPTNLLEGLTPEVAASFLKSALILAAGSGINSGLRPRRSSRATCSVS